MNVAVLHPGAMGGSLLAALRDAGHSACWLDVGRSTASRERATAAGAHPTDLAGLRSVDGVISVCPPDAAMSVAELVRDSGFRGTFVEANAIAPATVRKIANRFDAGVAVVDGGIVGPPAWTAGGTRLYLSGPQADSVAGWFAGSRLGAATVGPEIGAASALKMCYAAYTKGSSALLLAVRALAEAQGVTEALRAEWDLSQPGLGARSDATARAVGPKGWRFAGEMLEIAATFEAQGLPGDFHRAAAELYAKLGDFKDAEQVDPDALIRALLD